jgi:hypothetical protein
MAAEKNPKNKVGQKAAQNDVSKNVRDPLIDVNRLVVEDLQTDVLRPLALKVHEPLPEGVGHPERIGFGAFVDGDGDGVAPIVAGITGPFANTVRDVTQTPQPKQGADSEEPPCFDESERTTASLNPATVAKDPDTVTGYSNKPLRHRPRRAGHVPPSEGFRHFQN